MCLALMEPENDAGSSYAPIKLDCRMQGDLGTSCQDVRPFNRQASWAGTCHPSGCLRFFFLPCNPTSAQNFLSVTCLRSSEYTHSARVDDLLRRGRSRRRYRTICTIHDVNVITNIITVTLREQAKIYVSVRFSCQSSHPRDDLFVVQRRGFSPTRTREMTKNSPSASVRL